MVYAKSSQGDSVPPFHHLSKYVSFLDEIRREKKEQKITTYYVDKKKVMRRKN